MRLNDKITCLSNEQVGAVLMRSDNEAQDDTYDQIVTSEKAQIRRLRKGPNTLGGAEIMRNLLKSTAFVGIRRRHVLF